MSFAELIGPLSGEEMTKLRRLAVKAQWQARFERDDRHYVTAEVTDFWEPCERAFFVLIPPGGFIHPHSDEAIKGITHHLVLSTNNDCSNGWIEDGQEKSCHLEEGKRYLVAREPVHWADNKGSTDRIHLLVEYG